MISDARRELAWRARDRSPDPELLDVARDLLKEVDHLREVLSEIADGCERHNPGWWIKKAKAALARNP